MSASHPGDSDADREKAAELPFECPHCGRWFGFGDDAALLAVVTSLPFTDQPTPCCGELITGVLHRYGNNVELELIR